MIPKQQPPNPWLAARRRLWTQVGVILLAFGVFCAGLTSESLWLDEVSSIYNAQLPLAQVVREAAADTHPPLYYLVLHFTIKILSGNSLLHGHTGEFSARWPSVLAGVLSVAALMALARRLTRRASISPALRASFALCAGAFLALSAYERWYAQETRMYALLTLWGLLATYWLLRAGRLESRPPDNMDWSVVPAHPAEPAPHFTAARGRTAWTWAIYALLCMAGLYTHYYFVMVLLVHNLLRLVELARRRPQAPAAARRGLLIWLGVQGVIALAFAPWLPTLLTQVGRGEGLWIALAVGRPDLPTLAYALIQFIGMPVSGPAALRYASYALALALCAWGAWQIVQPAWRSVATVVLVYALAPVMAALLVSQARPIFASRYLLLSLPGWCLLLALGVTALPRAAWRWGAGAALVILLSVTVATQAVTPENPPWREVAAYVRAQAQPGDFAVFIPSFDWRPFTYYAGRDLVAYQDELWLPNDDLDWRAQFAAASRGHARIWLIWWRAHWGDPQGRVRELLDAQATLLSQRTFPGVDLVLLYDLAGKNLHP